jgi:hypothetical protein
MREAKQRSEQHLIDADGEHLLRHCLPRHWVLRAYRPDYGLDFSLEVFRQPTDKAKKHATYETLGEHLFIQLKSCSNTTSAPLQIYGRYNVEKKRERLNKADLVGQMETIRFSVDTPELVTVERMGVAVPVLLVVADLTAERCYFACLNDYVDKILVPRHDDYTTKNTRTIHVPVANQVGDPIIGASALRWYAKRAKLYAAFQRFVFQSTELNYAWDSSEFLPMARYFASRIAKYDFWDDTEMWELVGYYGSKVRHFLKTGHANLATFDAATVARLALGNTDEAHRISEQLRLEEVCELWKLLAALPQVYEDVCREWFLPTALGYASSYPAGDHQP